jgi:hypothetical protein
MILCRLLVVTALAATGAAQSPVAGKWKCANVQETGAESAWTLDLRQAGSKPAGAPTDREVDIPLSEVKLEGAALTRKRGAPCVTQRPYPSASHVSLIPDLWPEHPR